MSCRDQRQAKGRSCFNGVAATLAWLFVACGDHHSSSPELDAGADARVTDDAAIDGAANDGGADASDGAVAWTPEQCNQAFAALDDRCESDDDCALVVQTSCFYSGAGRGHALGVARGALGAFDQLAETCDLPRPENVFQRCPGEGGGLAPVYTDDQTARSTDLPMAVRCDSGRCVTFRTSCGPALCGNGALDACAISDSPHGPVYTPTTDADVHTPRETCDGEMLSQSCQDLGYGSGEVTCIAHSCLPDDRQCQPCAEPHSNGLAACVSDVNDGIQTDSHVMAASAGEIALLWTTYDGNTGERHVWFARFDRQLTLLSKAELSADVFVSSYLGLAAMPGGWMITAPVTDWSSGEGRDRVELHVLDALGQYDSLVHTVPGASQAQLVSRRDGMPLLIYTLNGPAGASVYVRAINSDVSLFEPRLLGVGDSVSATFVGDGYLVTLGRVTGSGALTTLHRVALDGTVSTVPNVFVLGDHFASLSNNGERTVLTFRREFDTVIRQLDADGEPTQGINDIVRSAQDFNGLVVAFGEGALLLRNDPGASNRITATQLGLDGELSELIELARHPGASVVSAALVDGSDAFVLVSGSGYGAPNPFAPREQMVSLARIVPFD